MKLETLFDKFDQFADAPHAVAKMRELVLHLALHGGFSGEDSKSWESSHLEDLLEVQNGFAFKSSLFNVVNHGMPLIRIRDIASSETQVYYSGEYRDEFIVHHGDLIIGMDGNFNIHRWRGRNALLNQRVCRLRNLSARIDQQFLFYFVQEHLDEIHRNTTYTTVKHISSKQINAIKIPLPPLAEQKRIVAKVDELMALCDRLEAQQQERDTRHAALAHASLACFADAPTPANLNFLFHSSYHIAPSDLRNAILTLTVHDDRPAGSSDSAVWSTVTMKEVCNLITDGEHATPQRVPSGVPLATAKNVRDGFLDMTQTDYVAPETAEKCWKRCRPMHGDILMVCVGATTGRVCLVNNPPDMVLVRSVALLRPNTNRIEARFLDLFLRSPSGQSQIWAGVRQNAQPCLYLGKMSGFSIQLPPLAEQRRIVAKVNQLMALVDELETQLTTSRATAKNLLEALVAELTAAPTPASKSKNNVTDLQATPEFKRAVLAAEIVGPMHSHATFGQVKLQKVIYLAEYIAELEEIDSQPKRHVNGPHDPELIEHIESRMKELDWYKAVPRKNVGKSYEPLSGSEKAQGLLTELWPDKAPLIEKLIDQMQTWKTERCERFATLYAAWNDLLIWGEEPTDQAILNQVLKHWHPDKKKIPLESWKESLAWIRENGYAPTGFGRSTSALPNLELF